MAFEINIQNRTFFVPESGDPCDTWKAFYAKLRREVGPGNARTIWLITWSKNGSVFCTQNAEFNRFLNKNDIDVSIAATRTVADLSAIGGNILGLGKNLSKMVSIGIPITVGILLAVILIMLINTASKVEISDLMRLHPTGRALSQSSKIKNAS